ncbi:MAG: DMT family transporter [Clostridiales Family XIII bacterium]|jgi:drug/metabolite transporter (DMT)-like permease|nr:DMT family transporter [Clostridiales Family XIII bacterium]
MKHSKFGYVQYIVALLIMATNGIVASYIPLNSYEIVFFRLATTSLFLLAIFLVRGGRFSFWKCKRSMKWLFLAGISTGINIMFVFEAYAQIGVSLTTILNYLAPIIIIVISPVVFKEALTGIKIAAIIVVFAGMLMVNFQALEQGKSAWGIACGILVAVTMVTNLVFLRKAEGIASMERVTCQLIIAFITVAIFVGVRQGYHFEIHADFILPLLIMCFVNGGIALSFYFSAYMKIPAQSVAILGYIEIPVALGLSAIILSERLSPMQFIGGALIIAGAMFAELYRRNVALQI